VPINNDERTVSHAQRGSRMRYKGGVTRRIYEIDFRIVVIEVGQRCVQRDLAGNGIFVVIGNSGSFINFSPAGRGAGDLEKGTDQLRLPRVAVSNDRKVANRLGCICFHSVYQGSFQT